MAEILGLLGFAIGDRHAKERLRFLGRFHFIGLLSFGEFVVASCTWTPKMS